MKKTSLFIACLILVSFAVLGLYSGNKLSLESGGFFNWNGTGIETDKQVKIGVDGTVNSIGSEGSLYVEQGIENDGTSYLNGAVVMGALIRIYNRTEAQLKATTPGAVGDLYYDFENSQLVISTGTGVAAFGNTWDGAKPTGW